MVEQVVFTDNPEGHIWSMLGLLESLPFVQDILRNRFPSISNEELEFRSHEITSCVKQAKEYFKSADGVTPLTSPLLLNYGMLNLGKALVYVRSPLDADLTTVFHKHGLNVPMNRQAHDLNDVYVEIKSHGGFQQMSNMYGENTYSNVAVGIKDLLSQIPDVSRLYEVTYGESPRVAPLYPIEYGFQIRGRGGDELFVEQLSETLEYLRAEGYTIQEIPPNITIMCSIASTRSLKEVGAVVSSLIEVDFIRTLPRVGDTLLCLKEQSLHFMIIFAYSMLARYQASTWRKLISPDTSRESQLIIQSIQVSRARFLRLMAEEIFEIKFNFRDSIERHMTKRELVDYIYDEFMRKMNRDIRYRHLF